MALVKNPPGWTPRQYPWDCTTCDIGPWQVGTGKLEGLAGDTESVEDVSAGNFGDRSNARYSHAGATG